MSGETSLEKLLFNINPVLVDGRFVFLSFNKGETFLGANESIMSFKEAEGETFITKEDVALANNKRFNDVWALITLNVHSDLKAIGFLAAITNKLAEAGISVNAISAYYHDHLFVPWDKRMEAMNILKSFSG